MSLLKKALANLANRADEPGASAPSGPVPVPPNAQSPASAAPSAPTDSQPAPAAQPAPTAASPARENLAAEFAQSVQVVVAAAPLGALQAATGFVAHDVAVEIDRKIGELYQIVSAALADDFAPTPTVDPQRVAPPLHISSVREPLERSAVVAPAPPQPAAPQAGRPSRPARAPIAFPLATEDAVAPYRQIRDRLQSERDAAGWTVLGLAATEAASEAFVASLLGQAFAEVGQARTLLIDARPRGPRDWQLAAVAQPAGLSDLVQGRSRWSDIILSTTFPGLDIATAGSLDWVDEPLPRGLWDALRSRYGVVLVDAGQVPKPAALRVAAACDATILAVHLSYDDRQSVRDRVQLLRQAGAELLGTIAVGASG